MNLFELHSDPEVMKFIRPPEKDIFETKKKIKSILKYTDSNKDLGLWTTWDKENNYFLGWVVLLHIEHNTDYPIEVSYRLHQKYWGKGYATEMINGMLNYAKDIGLERVCGITIEENKASQKVLEKAGLKYLEDRLYYETQVMYFEATL